MFKTIIKIITYFTVYINDETFFSFFGLKNPIEEEEDTEKIFFHCFTEASKLTNKILILLCHGVRQEYETVTYLINKKKIKEKAGINKQNKKLTKKSDDNNTDNKNSKEVVNTNNNNNNNEEDEQVNSMNNEEYQIILMRTLHIIQINLDFSLQKEDIYIQDY